MRRISVFNFTTLDGYFKGLDGDIGWHKHGVEENQYAANSLQGGSILLFGRVTFEMMQSYWTSSIALQNDPVVAQGMNDAEKLVASRKLTSVNWSNSSLLEGDLIESVRKLKQTEGKPITILGSGTIVTQLSEHRLIDQYLIMINPVAIGNGTSLFQGLKRPLDLRLTNMNSFSRGTVLLTYETAR